MSAASLRARLDRLGQRRTFRVVRDDAIERFLARRQAAKGPMPDVGVAWMVETFGPQGTLAGADPEVPDGTDDVLAGMLDPGDALTPDDPEYRATRLRWMTAFTLASRPLLRTIAHERGLTDADGRPVGADDHAELSRSPDTSARTPERWPDDRDPSNGWRFNDGR